MSIAVLTIASCQKEHFNYGKNGAEIGFDVNGVMASLVTRAAEGDVTILRPCEGQTDAPCLYVIKTPCNPSPGPDVKGTIITSGNIGTVYGKFTVNAIEAGKLQKFMDNVDVNYEGGKWVIDDKGETYRWPGGVDLSFWAYAPGYDDAGSFHITQVNHDSMVFDYSFEEPDATTPYTKDLILAHAKQSKGEVHLDFHHALAAVGAVVNDEQDPLVKILDCRFDGICTNGTCMYTESGLSWTEGDVKGGYKAPLDGDSAIGPDNPHFVIPQSLDDSKITVTVDNCGTQEIRSYSLNGTTWDPGYRYIYRLSYNPPVFDAYLVSGSDFNSAINALAAGTIEHIVFETGSDVASGTEVQIDGTRGKVYANYDSVTKTVTISTPCTNLYANKSCVKMFDAMKDMVSIDMSSVNTSLVTDMKYMFRNCEKLASLDLSGFDTNNVTDMYGMFFGCSNITSIDLSGFVTNNVTDMYGMFSGCEKLADLKGVKDFDTSNVTSMYGMFFGCEKLASLDLSGFNTSNVTDMKYMFYRCLNITSIDLSGFVTNKVTDMTGMFRECESLVDLKGVEDFDTGNVTQMTQMFARCKKLKKLDLSKYDVSKVTEFTYIFHEAESLEELNLSGWVTSQATSMLSLFHGCYSLSTLDLSSFDTRNVMEFQWFLGSEPVTNLKLGKNFVFNDELLAKVDALVDDEDGIHHAETNPFYAFIHYGDPSYSIWCNAQTYNDIKKWALFMSGGSFNWTWMGEVAP